MNIVIMIVNVNVMSMTMMADKQIFHEQWVFGGKDRHWEATDHIQVPPKSPLLPKPRKEFFQNTRLSADFHADPRMESYRRRTWATYGQGEWKWIF